jgi:hypothetical protein
MSRRARVVLSFAAALALSAGCSIVNDPASHMGGAEPIPGDELCTRLVALECDQYARCCSIAPPELDVNACIDANLADCEEGLGMLLADSRTSYDPVEAGRRFAVGAALSQDCSLDIAHWVGTREGLLGAFTGSIAPGGECTPRSDMDFAAYLSCTGVENACTHSVGRSICAARLGAGAGCALSGDCIDGLACVRTALLMPETWECGPRGAAGTGCYQSTDCESYLCYVPPMATIGTCVGATQDTVYCGVRR